MPGSEWGTYSFGPSFVPPHLSFPGLLAEQRLAQCQSSQTWLSNHQTREPSSTGISSTGRAGQVSSNFLALIPTSAASTAINNKGYLICEMHWSVKWCSWFIRKLWSGFIAKRASYHDFWVPVCIAVSMWYMDNNDFSPGVIALL